MSVAIGSGIAALGTIKARWVLVTPEMAEKFLEKNSQNRDVNRAGVERYKREMLAGRFAVSHQCIALDRAGVLIDGQHRLTAIIESGVSIWFLLVEGLDPMVRAATDGGTVRRAKDHLKILAGEQDGALVSSTIAMIRRAVYGTTEKQVFEELKLETEKYASGLAWAKQQESVRPWNGAVVMGALIFAYQTAPDLVDLVYRELVSGAISTPNDPILVLRDLVLPTKLTGDLLRIEIFGKVLSALWHRYHGRTPQKLYATKEAMDFFKRTYEAK